MLPENKLKVRGSIEEAGLTDLVMALASEFDSPCVVGGSVRDAILGKKISDFDFLVPKNASGAAAVARKILGGTRFCLDSDLGTFRVVTACRGSRLILDFANWTGPTIEEDLLSRDFTINAIAFRLSPGGDFIDPTGGLEDLAAGLVREAGAGSMASDHLRLLRLFRFRCQLGFRTDPATLAKAAVLAPGLAGVARERIREEFFKILSCPNHSETLVDLDSHGLLSRILDPASGGGSVLNPLGRVMLGECEWIQAYEHAVRDYLDGLEAGSAGGSLANAVMGGEAFSGDYSFVSFLRLCALLSNIGVFNDEISVGSLRLSNRERDCIKRSWSMATGWKNLALGGVAVLDRKGTEELIREAVGWGNSWPWVCAAGGAMAAGKGTPATESLSNAGAWAGFCSDLTRIRKKLNGRDLITLGLGQGPKIGRILNSAWAAGILGEWSTREEALTSLAATAARSSPSGINGSGV